MKLRVLLIAMCIIMSMIPIAVIIGLENFQIATAFLLLIIIITFSVALPVSYFISRPLETLTKNIDEISKGNLDVKLEKGEIVEINDLTDSLNRVMASLKLAIHKVGVKRGEIFEETVKAKEEAEEKYDMLLKNMDEWVFETDEKGICISCSSKITAALGYESQEVTGKSIFTFMAPEETKALKNTMNEMVRKNQFSKDTFKHYWLHKDGHHVYIHTRFYPLYNQHEEFIGWTCLSRDETEYKIVEEKIEELNKKLADMKDRMRQVLDSHDILEEKSHGKTPIGKITEEEFDNMFLFDNDLSTNSHLFDHHLDGTESQEMDKKRKKIIDYIDNLDKRKPTKRK